jgi:hypothetical protein
MSKTKLEKIATIEEQIEQLENQKKQLRQKHRTEERKARERRQCKRAGILESLLPETVSLTDEQFKTFLERTTANDFGRKVLSGITAQNTAKAESQPAESTAQDNPTPAAKSAEAEQGKTVGNAAPT